MNGAFGVYHSKKRLWRQKTKDKVTAMIGINYELDGQMMLIVGFSSGLVEVRKHRTGEVIQKIIAGDNPISNIFYEDFR